LDKEGRDIRFIKHGDWLGIGYDHEDKAVFALEDARNIEESIFKTNNLLNSSFRFALLSLDHSLLTRTVICATRLRDELLMQDRHFSPDYSEPDIGESEDLREFRAARVDDTVRVYQRLHEELHRVGIVDLLERHQSEMKIIPPEYALPQADFAAASITDPLPDGGLGLADHWQRRRLGEELRLINERRILFIVRNVSAAPRGAEKPEQPRQADGGRFSRWLSASIRVAAGSALTAANGLLGASVGFAGTLATVGMTTVPVAVGVAVSMHTGVTQVADGLEKIGGF
jgi:hypothetical protein